MSVKYYMAGGDLFFKKAGASTFVKVAGAQEIKVAAKPEYSDAFNHAGKTKTLAKRIPKKLEMTLSFKTNDISPANLAMFFLATTSAVAHSDTEAGWTEKQVTKLSLGQEMIFEGSFKFLSNNASGDPMILEVYSAAVTPSGEFPLQSEEVTLIGFDGTVLMDDQNRYADLYIDDVGA